MVPMVKSRSSLTTPKRSFGAGGQDVSVSFSVLDVVEVIPFSPLYLRKVQSYVIRQVCPCVTR